LSEREFRLVFAGHALSSLGDAMSPIAIAFAVLAIGGEAVDVGLVLGANVIGFVAVVLVGGVVADRFRRRTSMIGADLVRFVAQAVTAGLVISDSAQLWHLIALQAVIGAATGFFYPASVGLMPLVISPSRLQQANALRTTAQAGTGIVGQALSGILVAAAGAGASLVVDALTFAGSAGFLIRVRTPEQPRAQGPMIREFVDGWMEVRARSWLIGIISTLSIRNACWTAFAVLGPVIAADRLGGAAAWGVVLAAGSCGALVGGVLAIKLRPRQPLRLASVLLLLWPLQLLALAASTSVATIAAATFLSTLATMSYNTLWETTIQQQVPPSALSRVSSFEVLGTWGLQAAGTALVGVVAATIGVYETLFIAAAVMWLLPIVDLSIPAVRHLEAARVYD
jgi:MFS family permease